MKIPKKRISKLIVFVLTILILLVTIILIDKQKQLLNKTDPTAKEENSTIVRGIQYDFDNAIGINMPNVSAGMIPIKKDGENWIISKNEATDWYNYTNGNPAYIMLNDGMYQSELQTDMTNKKLASDYIGEVISENSSIAGSIYVWIPRFAYNEKGEIKHIKQGFTVTGTWTIPEIFTYKINNNQLPDLSLAGIWLKYMPFEENEDILQKVIEMNEENNEYGFISNTIAVSANNEETYMQITNNIKEIIGASNDYTLPEINNRNRTILKVFNMDETEPIKAEAHYDELEGKIKIQIKYSRNEIKKIMSDDGTQVPFTKQGEVIVANVKINDLTKERYYFIIIDDKGNIKEISVNEISLKYFGKLVTNYTCPVVEENDDLDIKWRIFYKDDKNIYLIADDYIPYSAIPKSQNGKTVNKYSNYSIYFSNVIGDYSGSEWILENTNSNAQKWLNKYLSKNSKNGNNNIKAVAYMMDTNVWGNLYAGEYAEYAIGGPTLELFCKSYELTHPNGYIKCDTVDDIGYDVTWDDDTQTSKSVVSQLPIDDFSGIYMKGSYDKAKTMWMASPSIYSTNYVMLACPEREYISAIEYYRGNEYSGFRPIVCLDSAVKLVKNSKDEDEENGDETYSLKWILEGSAEYDESAKKITIKVTSNENKVISIIDEETGTNIINSDGITGTKYVTKNGMKRFTIIDEKGYEIKIKIGIGIEKLYSYGNLCTDNTDGWLNTSGRYRGSSKVTFEGNYIDLYYGGYVAAELKNINISDFEYINVDLESYRTRNQWTAFFMMAYDEIGTPRSLDGVWTKFTAKWITLGQSDYSLKRQIISVPISFVSKNTKFIGIASCEGKDYKVYEVSLSNEPLGELVEPFIDEVDA